MIARHSVRHETAVRDTHEEDPALIHVDTGFLDNLLDHCTQEFRVAIRRAAATASAAPSSARPCRRHPMEIFVVPSLLHIPPPTRERPGVTKAMEHHCER